MKKRVFLMAWVLWFACFSMLIAFIGCEKDSTIFPKRTLKMSECIQNEKTPVAMVHQMMDEMQSTSSVETILTTKGGVDSSATVILRINNAQGVGYLKSYVDISVTAGNAVLNAISLKFIATGTVSFYNVYCEYSPNLDGKYGLYYEPVGTAGWMDLTTGYTLTAVYPDAIYFAWFSIVPMAMNINKGYLFAIPCIGTGTIEVDPASGYCDFSKDGVSNYYVTKISGAIN